MSRRRFYAPSEAFARNGQSVVLEADEAKHLREALRLKPGDEAFVFDGEGREFRCTVEEARRDTARLTIAAEVEPKSPESKLQLNLIVALLKGEKFDLVVQKATELGAFAVVPLMTNNADVRLRDARDAAHRVARWRRIALEAAKQSGRARVPVVSEPVAFESLMEDMGAGSEEWRMMFAERDGQKLSEGIGKAHARPNSISALVGSEGGWTDEEIARARSSGWSIVTLGGRILRAETAAITVAALLQYLCGDLD